MNRNNCVYRFRKPSKTLTSNLLDGTSSVSFEILPFLQHAGLEVSLKLYFDQLSDADIFIYSLKNQLFRSVEDGLDVNIVYIETIGDLYSLLCRIYEKENDKEFKTLFYDFYSKNGIGAM